MYPVSVIYLAMSLLIIFTLIVYFLQLFARFTILFSFAQFLFTFLLIFRTSLRFSAHTLIMIFVNFCTFLLLYYWKLFALKLFMVFIVFQVFAHFCNIFFQYSYFL